MKIVERPFKVGDKVYCLQYGAGVVTNTTGYISHPLIVMHENEWVSCYKIDGRYLDTPRSLYHFDVAEYHRLTDIEVIIVAPWKPVVGMELKSVATGVKQVITAIDGDMITLTPHYQARAETYVLPLIKLQQEFMPAEDINNDK